jgi:hypothetical protein
MNMNKNREKNLVSFVNDDPRINRNGRPRKPKLPKWLKAEEVEPIIRTWALLALKGSVPHGEALMNLAYGKAPQTVVTNATTIYGFIDGSTDEEERT